MGSAPRAPCHQRAIFPRIAGFIGCVERIKGAKSGCGNRQAPRAQPLSLLLAASALGSAWPSCALAARLESRKLQIGRDEGKGKGCCCMLAFFSAQAGRQACAGGEGREPGFEPPPYFLAPCLIKELNS